MILVCSINLALLESLGGWGLSNMEKFGLALTTKTF